jgi:hypothetical protein
MGNLHSLRKDIHRLESIADLYLKRRINRLKSFGDLPRGIRRRRETLFGPSRSVVIFSQSHVDQAASTESPPNAEPLAHCWLSTLNGVFDHKGCCRRQIPFDQTRRPVMAIACKIPLRQLQNDKAENR